MIALVVDDSPFFETAKTALVRLGCSVLHARSGSDAILEAVTSVPELALIAVTLADLEAVQVAMALRQFAETADMVLIAAAADDAATILDRCHDGLFDGQIASACSDEQIRSAIQIIFTNRRVAHSKQVALATDAGLLYRADPKTDPVLPAQRKKRTSKAIATETSPIHQLPTSTGVDTSQNGVSFARWGAQGRWTAIPSVMANNLRSAGAEVISASHMEALKRGNT